MTTEIAVRFVLSGACHPHSGRQVLFIVPCEHVTVQDMLNTHIRDKWPSEDLPDLAERVRDCGLKVLKKGRVLEPTDKIDNVVTQEEKLAAIVKETEEVDGNKLANAVLMHLVFSPMSSRFSESEPPAAALERASKKSDRQQEPKSDKCCSVM